MPDKERRWPDYTYLTRLTWREFCAVMVGIVVCGLLILPFVSQLIESGRKIACADNMRQLALSFKMYANENDGEFPPIAAQLAEPMDCGANPIVALPDAEDVLRVSLSPDVSRMYPEYFDNPEILICPSNSDHRSQSFINPVGGSMDIHQHCQASCRGATPANASYTYLSHWSNHIGTDSATMAEIIAIQPFDSPDDSAIHEMIVLWNRGHPDRKYAIDASEVQRALDVRLMAWAQALFDTGRRGDSNEFQKVVDSDLVLFDQDTYQRPNYFFFENPYPISINDSNFVFQHGGTGANLDWDPLVTTIESADNESNSSNVSDSPTSQYKSDPRVLYRNDEPVGRIYITDYRHRYLNDRSGEYGKPVVWDRFETVYRAGQSHHRGSNVLFLDGHVEFLRYESPEFDEVFPEPVRRSIDLIQHYVDAVNKAPTGNPRIDAQCP